MKAINYCREFFFSIIWLFIVIIYLYIASGVCIITGAIKSVRKKI